MLYGRDRTTILSLAYYDRCIYHYDRENNMVVRNEYYAYDDVHTIIMRNSFDNLPLIRLVEA